MNKGALHVFSSVQFSSSVVPDSVTPWTTARQASLSITNSQSLPKLKSIESVIPSNHLILYCPLLLLPSIFPSIRVFSNESALHIRWSKYWSFSFNISSSNEHPGLISHIQGAVAAWAQEGLEELSHVEGQEGRRWGDTTCQRWGAAAALYWSSREEIPHAQGKRNPSKIVDVARGHTETIITEN